MPTELHERRQCPGTTNRPVALDPGTPGPPAVAAMCRSRVWRANHAAVLSIALIGLAACGGGGDDAADDPSTSAVESDDASDPTDEQTTTVATPAPTSTMPAASTVPITSASPR